MTMYSKLSTLKVGDEVALVNFTQKRTMGIYPIAEITIDEIIIDTKRKGRQVFSLFTGVQLNSKKDHKFANKLSLVDEAPPFIPQSDKPRQKKTKKIVDFSQPSPVKKGLIRHYRHEMIKACVIQNIPVYLVGEAGTGKNHVLKDIAEELQLDFHFTNSVQQEYKLTGFIDAGGEYHETEFFRAFTKGGLFFLDELDASIPEVLVLLNAAIANGYFDFPGIGKTDAHADFRVVAAGNTSGTGANEMYTGRMVIDSATLDRFVEITFDYDKAIERHLANGNDALVGFVRSLRKCCKDNGIRATFSYRCIINVTKLESIGMKTEEILRIAVLKGMDKDTVNTLQVHDSGKYYFALKNIQGAA